MPKQQMSEKSKAQALRLMLSQLSLWDNGNPVPERYIETVSVSVEPPAKKQD